MSLNILRSLFSKGEQCMSACVVFGILLVAGSGMFAINPSSAQLVNADGSGLDTDMKQAMEIGNEQCCICSRELWRVLYGGATTLASLLVSLGGWYHSDFHEGKKKICGFSVSPFRAFITIVAGSLLPQIFMSFVLSSAVASVVLQQRVASKGKKKDEDKVEGEEKATGWKRWCVCRQKGKTGDKGTRLAKRICTMVVWIRVNENTYKSLFEKNSSLSGLFSIRVIKPGSDKGAEVPAPGIEDALFFKDGKSLRASPAQVQHTNYTAEEHNLATRPPTTTDQLAPCTSYYYLCSQSWDAKTLLWKEALLQTEGVLPEVEELQMVQTRTNWECGIVAAQSLGYLVSFLSRFAYGRDARVSAVEVMSAWISVALVVQVLVIPTLATYCNRGICLDLSDKTISDVIKYYQQKKERKEPLNWQTLTVLLLCLGFLFALFLILIPPLVYYYYRVNRSALLTFVSLLPFTIVSGVAVVAFVLTLIFPPHTLIDFLAFPYLRPPPPQAHKSFKYLPVISLAILMVGLSSYVLAVIDTTLNWHLFRARDCYISSFIIPHIGS